MEDLFEHYETLPANVKKALYFIQGMDNTYENCRELKEKLNLIGYTCDYGLDAEPYELRKL